MSDHAKPGSLRDTIPDDTTWVLANRSATVTIVNDMPTTALVLNGHASELGTLMNAPSSIIQPGGSTSMRIRDDNGPFGSKGWLRYTVGGDGAEILVTFECPTVANSTVSANPKDRVTVSSFDPNGSLDVEIRVH